MLEKGKGRQLETSQGGRKEEPTKHIHWRDIVDRFEMSVELVYGYSTRKIGVQTREEPQVQL